MWKQYLIGIVISGAAIGLFLAKIDIGDMAASLGEMNLIYFLPVCLIYLGAFFIRTLRWHYLMRPVGRIGFKPLFSAYMIGFLANNLLPAHLGEVVRAYVLGKTQNVSKSATFATIVMERVYDGLTVLFLLMIVLIFMDFPKTANESLITVEGLRQAGWWGLALFAGLLFALQFFRWQRKKATALLGFCLKPLPDKIRLPLLEMADAFADGLAASSLKDLGMVVLYSLGTWVALGLWAWSLFFAFDLDLGVMAGILMEVVVALALLIPTAPAFLGVFHLAAASTLAFFGQPEGVAGAYAMALWLSHFVVTTIVGLYFVWKQGLSWSDLKKQA